MATSSSRHYLYCQLIAWSMLLVWLISFNSIIVRQHTPATVEISLITCLAGLFTTHLLRYFMETIEKKRLELQLKEKELSAEGPVVDIDFIISSLDRIRSLIDDDPGSARAGITAFSQLLRKGQLKTD